VVPLLRAVTAIALLALAVAIVGPARLASHLQSVDPGWFAMAVAVGILSNIASAWRWSRLGRRMGLHAPFRPMLTSYAQGAAVNVLLPGATIGGDTLRSIQLARLGNPLGLSSISVVLDRVSGLWVLCAMSALVLAGTVAAAAVGHPHARTVVEGAVARAGAAPLVLYGSLLVLALLLPVAAIALGRAPADASRHPWWNRLAAARVAVSAHGPALGRSLPDSVLVQLLSATALWLAARAAGADAALLAVLAIAAPIFVAAAIPISMAGFGPREVTAGLAFAAIGASSSVGVAAAILYGLTSVLQGVAATPLLAMQRERPEVPRP
jgi:uncharacterized membrane protein YbhN (UPF0104 family)